MAGLCSDCIEIAFDNEDLHWLETYLIRKVQLLDEHRFPYHLLPSVHHLEPVGARQLPTSRSCY
jgi:hypothetical protein